MAAGMPEWPQPKPPPYPADDEGLEEPPWLAIVIWIAVAIGLLALWHG